MAQEVASHLYTYHLLNFWTIELDFPIDCRVDVAGESQTDYYRTAEIIDRPDDFFLLTVTYKPYQGEGSYIV